MTGTDRSERDPARRRPSAQVPARSSPRRTADALDGVLSGVGNAALARLVGGGQSSGLRGERGAVLARMLKAGKKQGGKQDRGILQYPPRSEQDDPEGRAADLAALYTPEGVDEEIPNGYRTHMFRGGTVYRRAFDDPLAVFVEGWGWRGDPNFADHVTKNQGAGSCWIGTSETLDNVPTEALYGVYIYEIELTPHQAVRANETYTMLTKHQNPFAHQQEIAVWRRILGTQVTAVTVVMQDGQVQRLTRKAYADARKDETAKHPPPRGV